MVDEKNMWRPKGENSEIEDLDTRLGGVEGTLAKSYKIETTTISVPAEWGRNEIRTIYFMYRDGIVNVLFPYQLSIGSLYTNVNFGQLETKFIPIYTQTLSILDINTLSISRNPCNAIKVTIDQTGNVIFTGYGKVGDSINASLLSFCYIASRL